MRPEWIAATLFLLGSSVPDLRCREIDPLYTAVFGMFGVFAGIAAERPLGEVLFAMLPGCLLLLSSAVSRGGIGPGDGIVVNVLGLYLPGYDVAFVCLAGFCLAAIPAAVLFLMRRRNTTLPFVPFLCAGCVAVWICGG